MTAIALLLFVGATGKSAQIPLYVWLPDAMEGPTPVSALIHAATMVTAGVYMVTRMNAVFQLAPVAMAVVATIGAVTAIFAATMGLVQNDIKRVLAYSTVSQLGYMFLALGVGAFTAGIFHLMTHAFFKALLFLGSGSVIHAMSGEQDMRKMGALWSKIPITARTFMIAHDRDLRHSAAGRLLQQGRHPGRGVRRAAAAVGDRLHHRGHDGVLHVPPGEHDVLRRVARIARGRASPARIAVLDDRAADDSGGAFDRGRMDWLAGIAGRQRPLRAFPRSGDRAARRGGCGGSRQRLATAPSTR